ncbi:MAG: hypothetical protein JWO09_2669 [Bacteroidetes bacterium]|nr:hypothetical protein [Bacteroidota bacterium]
MKNYKVLENRRELTTEQIQSGLDFNKIKSNAAIVKSALLKALLIKTSLGLVFVASLAFVYVNYFRAPENKQAAVAGTEGDLSSPDNNIMVVPEDTGSHQPIAINDERPEANSMPSAPEAQPAVDTAGVTKQAIPAATNDSAEIKTAIVKDSTVRAEKNTIPKKEATASKSKLNKLLQVKTCKFWDVKSFCDLPRNTSFPYSVNCMDCEHDYINCTDLKDVKAIWMTITVKGSHQLQLESKFKNITLTHAAGGKPSHPVAVAISNDAYLGKEFKAKKFTANYKQQIDVFLFFPEAQPGDVILINGQVEAIIEN